MVMRRPGFFLVVCVRVAFALAAFPSLALALSGTAIGAETPQATPSLTPLEWNRSLMARGRVSEKLGQNEDALADYTLAIESHALPTDEQARALFDRGLLLDGMSRLDDALGDYSASLLLMPQFAAALNNRANVYRRLGRLTEARRDYLASLEAGNPQSQYCYFGLGQIAEAEGGKAEAQQFYARALAADPRYDLARERLTALSSGEQMVRLEPPGGETKPVAMAATAPPPDAGDDSQVPITLRPPGLAKPITRHVSVAPAAVQRGPQLKPSLGDGQITPQGTQVQLGAWRSEQEADEGWDHALERAGDALKGHSPHIVTVVLPRVGRYYRLRVAAGEEGPKALCATLSARGLDCLPVRD